MITKFVVTAGVPQVLRDETVSTAWASPKRLLLGHGK